LHNIFRSNYNIHTNESRMWGISFIFILYNEISIFTQFKLLTKPYCKKTMAMLQHNYKNIVFPFQFQSAIVICFLVFSRIFRRRHALSRETRWQSLATLIRDLQHQYKQLKWWSNQHNYLSPSELHRDR